MPVYVFVKASTAERVLWGGARENATMARLTNTFKKICDVKCDQRAT